MPKFEFNWVSRGSATVEADDMIEGQQVLTDSLEGFDTFLLESVEVEDVEITDGEELA